ncbi:hypothetical protein [Streptomyces sp. SBT349]|uniref:hypothetical protein n=1 Tax=Streptomyces sp. SBT349 TaxID=1580539 RepID=UPI00066E79F6|nr:hypothetical protein [Streptomyces sp. SBT349]
MSSPVGVRVSVEVDVYTVRRGDRVMIGGQPFVVCDLREGWRLEFETGEVFTMRRTTVLWAARLMNPRSGLRRV